MSVSLTPEPVCTSILLSKSVFVPVSCNEGYAWKHWNTVILRTTEIVLKALAHWPLVDGAWKIGLAA